MKLPWVYLDTSVYLKLFLKEKGSDKARKLATENSLLCSAILASECFSALSRRKQNREMDDKVFDQLVSSVKKDLQYIELVKLTDEVLRKTEEVVLHSPARTLDAIHIASALLFSKLTGIELSFMTADKKQEEAARSAGLKTLFI